MKIKDMTLQQLEMQRFYVREQIVLAKGVHKRDLVKNLKKLNDEIGKRRKQCLTQK